MAKIIQTPSNIPAPEFSIDKLLSGESEKESNEFISKIKSYCKANGSGPLAGTEVKFPIADGYAKYVILSSSPAVMMHLKIDDAWDARVAHTMNGKQLALYVESCSKLDALFG